MKGLFVLIFALALSPVFAKEKILPEPTRVISAAQLDAALIKECIAGMHPEMAIEFQPGTDIPLRLIHHAPLISFTFNPNLSVKVEKLCYLRFVKRKVYMSEDMVKWNKPDPFSGKTTAEISLNTSGLLVESTTVAEPYEEFED